MTAYRTVKVLRQSARARARAQILSLAFTPMRKYVRVTVEGKSSTRNALKTKLCDPHASYSYFSRIRYPRISG